MSFVLGFLVGALVGALVKPVTTYIQAKYTEFRDRSSK